MTGPILPLPPSASGKRDGKAPSAPEQAALRAVARNVLRKARHQEFVVAREIREELVKARLSEDLWKEVVGLAGTSLGYRHSRYYYVPVGRSRMQVRIRHEQRHQQAIHRTVRWMIRRQHSEETVHHDRRAHKRVGFCRSLLVQTEDKRLFQWVTREISLSGIRLLCGCNLEGQKLRLWITFDADNLTHCFLAQILWSAAVGDNLYENGGIFLELLEGEPHPLRLADE